MGITLTTSPANRQAPPSRPAPSAPPTWIRPTGAVGGPAAATGPASARSRGDSPAPGTSPAPVDDLVVATDALTKTYNGVNAVDAVSLRVPAGGIYGFLGPNGAGKSTTMKLLLGLTRPTSGTMSVLDD